jgi:two-component system phosphate regulon response regulator PhoB
MPARILIGVKDAGVAMLLNSHLEADGFESEMVSGYNELRRRIRNVLPNGLVVDWSFLKMGDLAPELAISRGGAALSCALMVLAEDQDEIECINKSAVGADQVLVKPFSVALLSKLLKQKIHLANPKLVCDQLVVEDIVLIREAHMAMRAGKRLRVGRVDLKLLTLFMERSCRVVTREQILDRVWGPCATIDLRTVDVYIGRLRRALTQGKGRVP